MDLFSYGLVSIGGTELFMQRDVYQLTRGTSTPYW